MVTSRAQQLHCQVGPPNEDSLYEGSQNISIDLFMMAAAYSVTHHMWPTAAHRQ